MELVGEGTVALKQYGAAKVWLIDQKRFPEVDPSLLDSMDEQINVRRLEFNDLIEKNKALEKELKEATSSLSNQQLADLVTKLTSENASMSQRVHDFRSGGI